MLGLIENIKTFLIFGLAEGNTLFSVISFFSQTLSIWFLLSFKEEDRLITTISSSPARSKSGSGFKIVTLLLLSPSSLNQLMPIAVPFST